jgi:FAD/FMN-containing dehydrogenase
MSPKHVRAAIQLIVIWTVPAIFAAGQSWLGLRGRGGDVSIGGILLFQLASWYVWAALTPVVIGLARRWPASAATRGWMLRHLGMAVAFAAGRILFERLVLIPLEGLPMSLTTIERGLQGDLRLRLLVNVAIYAVVLGFAAASHREQADSDDAGADSGSVDN